MRFLPPGTELENYIITEEIAETAEWLTYRVNDARSGGDDHKLLMWEYFPRDMGRRSGLRIEVPEEHNEAYESGLNRFLGIGLSLRSLSNASVQSVRASFIKNGAAYIVAEVPSGETFAELLNRQGTIDRTYLISALRSLTEAVGQMHAADMAHMNIRPENVMRRADGRPILVNFEKSWRAADPVRAADLALARDAFSAIELVEDGHSAPGFQADLYSIAAFGHMALFGIAPPMPSDRRRVLSTGAQDPVELINISDRSPEYRRLKSFITWGLAIAPERRPSSASEWLAHLDRMPGSSALSISIPSGTSDRSRALVPVPRAAIAGKPGLLARPRLQKAAIAVGVVATMTTAAWLLGRAQTEAAAPASSAQPASKSAGSATIAPSAFSPRERSSQVAPSLSVPAPMPPSSQTLDSTAQGGAASLLVSATVAPAAHRQAVQKPASSLNLASALRVGSISRYSATLAAAISGEWTVDVRRQIDRAGRLQQELGAEISGLLVELGQAAAGRLYGSADTRPTLIGAAETEHGLPRTGLASTALRDAPATALRTKRDAEEAAARELLKVEATLKAEAEKRSADAAQAATRAADARAAEDSLRRAAAEAKSRVAADANKAAAGLAAAPVMQPVRTDELLGAPSSLPAPVVQVAAVAAVAKSAPAPKSAAAPAPASPAPSATTSGRPVQLVRVSAENPPYPSRSAVTREEGDTLLEVCSDEAGKITDARIKRSSGSERLDAAAEKWAIRSRFKPVEVDGKPAARCGSEVNVRWRLPKG